MSGMELFLEVRPTLAQHYPLMSTSERFTYQMTPFPALQGIIQSHLEVYHEPCCIPKNYCSMRLGLCSFFNVSLFRPAIPERK